MNNIDRLLNDLNEMFPLSADFWKELPSMLTEKRKKSGYVFLKPGNIATKAWQLLSGFIIMIRKDEEGKDIVARIYYPQQIVTDLKSFFDEVPISCKFIGIGDVNVLEIKRADVDKMRQYQETYKLIQHISFLDVTSSESLINILRLSPKARIKSFFETFPVATLPCKYCASVLNLSDEVYLENKLLLENEGLLPAKEVQVKKHSEESSYSAYKVKDYLQNNFYNPEIGSTAEIAEHFNTTSRTLNRTFSKSFGFTVTKYILRCRMEHALDLLNSKHLQVGEVATAVGYKNIFHFSTEFKKYFGYPPKVVKGD
jgi:AraC-like DNA-binding protein